MTFPASSGEEVAVNVAHVRRIEVYNDEVTRLVFTETDEIYVRLPFDEAMRRANDALTVGGGQ